MVRKSTGPGIRGRKIGLPAIRLKHRDRFERKRCDYARSKFNQAWNKVVQEHGTPQLPKPVVITDIRQLLTHLDESGYTRKAAEGEYHPKINEYRGRTTYISNEPFIDKLISRYKDHRDAHLPITFCLVPRTVSVQMLESVFLAYIRSRGKAVYVSESGKVTVNDRIRERKNN